MKQDETPFLSWSLQTLVVHKFLTEVLSLRIFTSPLESYRTMAVKTRGMRKQGAVSASIRSKVKVNNATRTPSSTRHGPIKIIVKRKTYAGLSFLKPLSPKGEPVLSVPSLGSIVSIPLTQWHNTTPTLRNGTRRNSSVEQRVVDVLPQLGGSVACRSSVSAVCVDLGDAGLNFVGIPHQ